MGYVTTLIENTIKPRKNVKIKKEAGPDGEIGEPLNISQMIRDFRSGGTSTQYQRHLCQLIRTFGKRH